jgi:hypothetical protein
MTKSFLFHSILFRMKQGVVIYALLSFSDSRL